MMKLIISLGLVAAFSLGASACGGGDSYGDGDKAVHDSSKSGVPAPGTDNGAVTSVRSVPQTVAGDVKQYIFHGTVTKIDTEQQMITIDHEKIDGYMEAMTMPFKVADPALLSQVKVGDATHFTLKVAGDQAMITKVEEGHGDGAEH